MNFLHCNRHFPIRALAATVLLLLTSLPGRSAERDPASWREIETKYIFGFTTGSGIGLEGEKEFSIETIGRFGKRDGRYSATETKFEFETTPTQFIQVEFGALASTHSITGVTDIDDRRQIAFAGLFGELRYLVLERGPSSPFAVTASFEPTWRRIDETGGERVTNYELEFKIAADTQLVENRVYLGFNFFYEPEWVRTSEGELERESKIGVSTAIALRVAAPLLIGAEVGYFRHYDGVGVNRFTGDAVFVGPTLYYQVTPKVFVAAAWAIQVAGREVDNPGASLNLAEFQRHRAKLKVAVEF